MKQMLFAAQIYGSAREVDHSDGRRLENLEAKIVNVQRLLQLRMFLLFLTMTTYGLCLYGSRRYSNYEYSFERLLSSLAHSVQ